MHSVQQAHPNGDHSRGREQPVKAWTRRRMVPTISTSSSTLPAPRMWPIAHHVSITPHPHPHRPLAGIFSFLPICLLQQSSASPARKNKPFHAGTIFIRLRKALCPCWHICNLENASNSHELNLKISTVGKCLQFS